MATPLRANDYECLSGGPPGVYIKDDDVYVFVAVGQNPGGMGCYFGKVNGNAKRFERCENNPLFVGAGEYGPLEEKGTCGKPLFRLSNHQFGRSDQGR